MTGRRDERAFRRWCLFPAIFVLLAVNVFPILWLIVLSFTRYRADGNRPPEWIGWENYARILKAPETWQYFHTTFKFVASAVSLQIIFGVVIALLLHRGFRGRSLVTTLVVFPMMVSAAVLGQFWKLLLDANWGLVPYVMSALGWSGPAINWFSKDFALWALVLVDTWMWTPFVALIALAGLASVPRELYEAASVDRANDWSQFWHVTLPVVAPVLGVAAILRTMDGLRMFDIGWILTEGGPGIVTETVPLQLYRQAFRFVNTGGSAALAVIYLIIVTILAKILLGRLARIREGRPADEKPIRRWFFGIAVGGLFLWLLPPWMFVLVGALLVGGYVALQLPRALRHGLALAAVAIPALVSLVPIGWIVVTSLKERKDVFGMPPIIRFEVTWENYRRLLEPRPSGEWAPFVGQLAGSLGVGLVTTFVTVFIGTLAAYAFSRYQFRGKNDWLFFILSTRMLPAVVVAIPIVLLFRSVGLMDRHLGLVILYTAMNMALAVWIMKAFLDEVPRTFEEAAILERCTPAQAFFRVIFPLIQPAMLTTALFVFLACWNEYAFSLFLSTQRPLTAPPAITSVRGTGGVDWGLISAGSSLLTLPALALTLLARNHLLRGVTFGVVDSK